MKVDRSYLLSGRILAANALWSLAAQAIPAVVGVIAIPFILRGLGVERFGVLTLAWMVIGYFSLFDLGLGRAVTKLAAELAASDKHSRINRTVWTAWYLMFALGVGAALLLTAMVPWLVGSALKVPLELQEETRRTFFLLAWSIPIVVITTGFRGLLEAEQRFRLTTLVKIPLGVMTFIIPLLVLRFTASLVVIVVALIAVRIVGAIAYAIMCQKALPQQTRISSFDRSAARALLRFGAWITVSNVVSPLMVSADRFFVGAFLSLAAVAYYATPFEAVTKLLIIPGAITAVLFPAFSTASMLDQTKLVALFRAGLRSVFLGMYPIIAVVITFAPDLLRFWLGEAFAIQSSEVLRWLALGVLTNTMASVPFALLQGVGRPDTTAKIHLVEAPLYVVILIFLVRQYGITGAAIAWCIRTTIDMSLLYWRAAPYLRGRTSGWFREVIIPASLTLGLMAGFLVQSLLHKVVLSSMLLLAFAGFTCYWQLASRADHVRWVNS